MNKEEKIEIEENAFTIALIHELHEINLSLRRLSGRDLKVKEPKTYKDFYFGKDE